MIEAFHDLTGTILGNEIIKNTTAEHPIREAYVHPDSRLAATESEVVEGDSTCVIQSPVPINSKPLTAIPPRTSRRHAKKLSNKSLTVELPTIHSGSTLDTFRDVLEVIDTDRCEVNGENAFYVCDLANVYRLYLGWQKVLGGRVEPFYAVKCNPDPHIIHLFGKLGLGFDCASHGEIDMVLANGVSPSNIIYANPCKAGSFIRHAHEYGVQMMTFDNADELHKVAKYHPTAKMVIRILTDDRGSLCRFGEKFGTPLEDVHLLLETARQLGVDVIGVAFHVGSGCTNPDLYKEAVGNAKWVFELATQYGFEFDLLDVGGGFSDDNFEILAEGLLSGLDEYFPIGCGVRVIAEPGRYFVTGAFELATNVIARRQAYPTKKDTLDGTPIGPNGTEEPPVTMYYINDGVYGAFNCTMFDHKVVHPEILTLGGKFNSAGLGRSIGSPEPSTPDLDSSLISLESFSSVLTPTDEHSNEDENRASFASLELQSCKIFGPSCDSIDLVCPQTLLPTKALKVGDWLRWKNMGAYTICAASQFNGFKISQVRYTIDSKGDQAFEDQLRMIIKSHF